MLLVLTMNRPQLGIEGAARPFRSAFAAGKLTMKRRDQRLIAHTGLQMIRDRSMPGRNRDASGVTVSTSFKAKLERASCGGFAGIGWVGEGCFAGDVGRHRYLFLSHRKIGLPVTRFKMNSSAFLFITATAGMVLPSFFTSSSTGGVSRS